MPETRVLDSPEVAKAQPLRPKDAALAGGPATVRPAPPEKKSKLGWIILGIATAGIVWFFLAHPAASRVPTAVDLPVPVVSGTVTTEDVPIYLDGIGNVQAFNTVTVHSRVDGQLTKVAFTEGQDVKEGDTLAIIDPAPFQTALDQAAGKEGEDAAQLANAKLDLSRDTDLLARKVISSQVYDTQKALVDQLQATVAADLAAIASARVQLGYTTITAPISGRLGIRQIDQGNIIHATDANGLVVITQLEPISVLFTLPEQNLTQILRQTSDPKGLPVLAVDRNDSTILDTGTLAVINNQIDATTGTIQIKGTFANSHHQLWPGAFVNARLLLTTRKNGIVVPASVVQRGPEGAYAFVITPKQTAEVRKIKVAQIEASKALIDDGLRPGEIVVVDGQYKLQPGSKVKVAGLPARQPRAHATPAAG